MRVHVRMGMVEWVGGWMCECDSENENLNLFVCVRVCVCVCGLRVSE